MRCTTGSEISHIHPAEYTAIINVCAYGEFTFDCAVHINRLLRCLRGDSSVFIHQNDPFYTTKSLVYQA